MGYRDSWAPWLYPTAFYCHSVSVDSLMVTNACMKAYQKKHNALHVCHKKYNKIYLISYHIVEL